MDTGPAQAVRRRSIGSRRNPATEFAILAAARSILAERGYAGFSIDDVARRAGAGKPTIYRWWPTRADLLLAVYDEGSGARLAQPDTGRLAEDLATFARSALAAWRDTPAGQALRGLFAEAQAGDAALLALWDRFLGGWLRPIRAMFGAAARRGEADPGDIEMMIELYSGFLFRRLLTGQTDDDRAAVERMARLIASGRGKKEPR